MRFIDAEVCELDLLVVDPPMWMLDGIKQADVAKALVLAERWGPELEEVTDPDERRAFVQGYLDGQRMPNASTPRLSLFSDFPKAFAALFSEGSCQRIFASHGPRGGGTPKLTAWRRNRLHRSTTLRGQVAHRAVRDVVENQPL